jgi:hypothetical protein
LTGGKAEIVGAGIDYGLGMSNVDRETGIRYGVINQNECLQAWADSSEADYPEMECSSCGLAGITVDMAECPECGADFCNEFDYIKAAGYVLDDGEYKAEAGDDGDIFITKSPFFTLYAFCSPCARGAGYIMDSRENGVKAYCFGHDWFDDGKAPYLVYRVDGGEQVYADSDIKGRGETGHIRAED